MKQNWDETGAELARRVVRGCGRVVARAATLGHGRRPLAWVIDEFFVAIAHELEAQGVSRRVAGDLFGMSRRTFVRNLRRAEAGAKSEGRTFWAAILEELRRGPRSREDVLARFPNQPPDVIRSIVYDLVESGLIEEKDGKLSALHESDTWSDEQLRTLIAILWMDGSLSTAAELAERLRVDEAAVTRAMDDFLEQERPVHIPDVEENASLQGLLSLMASHVLDIIYDELDGRRTASGIFGFEVAEGAEDRLDMLQDAARTAVEEFRARAHEIGDKNAPKTELDSHVATFTAFFSHRVDRTHGEQDDEAT